MKSAIEQKNIERNSALLQWLYAQHGLSNAKVEPMVGDASFRRYFRVVAPSGSYVAMDAPPTHENCRPFIAIAQALRKLKLSAPEIIAADTEQGFLLLTDFGSTTYLAALTAQNADPLYHDALDALVILQDCKQVQNWSVPAFTGDFMRQEWTWHKEWFLGNLLKLQLTKAEEKALDQCVARVIELAATQPQVFMHRDYHSANLMRLEKPASVGILDFQDAFMGPITYDLVSLLRDCYIDWPVERVQAWTGDYLYKLKERNFLRQTDEQEFLHWFDWMGIERHLKALFTFARKHVRDQQSHYLKHVPRTLNYLLYTSQQYSEFAVLHDYLQSTVQPAFASLACEV